MPSAALPRPAKSTRHVSLARGYLPFEQAVYLLGDGHLDAMLAGQRDASVGSLDALGHYAHGADDLCKVSSLAQLDSDRAVAAQVAGAREDQGRRGRPVPPASPAARATRESGVI